MIKQVKNMLEVYGNDAKRYDYFMRVLASFAEIYNYDYSMSSLMENGKIFDEKNEVIRKNGILPRIRGYFSNHLNEQETNTKLFYNEVVLDEFQHQEYGYLTIGKFSESTMADMISLAVRLLESCGIRDVEVTLSEQDSLKEKLESYLDALDITYSYKDIHVYQTDRVSFEITKKVNNEEVLLISGGSYSSFTKKLSGLETQIFGFHGLLDVLVSITKESLRVDEKILDVVVTYESDEELFHALYLMQELRLNGFKTECIKRCEKSYIKKYYNTKYVLSVKEEGMKRNEFVLTDLYTNEKEKVNEMDLIQHLDMNF